MGCKLFIFWVFSKGKMINRGTSRTEEPGYLKIRLSKRKGVVLVT